MNIRNPLEISVLNRSDTLYSNFIFSVFLLVSFIIFNSLNKGLELV